MECGMALQLWACSLPLRLFFNPIRTRRGRRVYQPSPAVHGGYPADNPSSPTLYPAPSGLICFCLIPQGVALSWYIAPLQGLHLALCPYLVMDKCPVKCDTAFNRFGRGRCRAENNVA
jgi:hypothetical protein